MKKVLTTLLLLSSLGMTAQSNYNFSSMKREKLG
ncbi:MAG: hypothetical protein H6Q12_845, partial [Bacteroidetes bacterium]|nr:hypothetical protein [Bacteroidota bacterium]